MIIEYKREMDMSRENENEFQILCLMFILRFTLCGNKVVDQAQYIVYTMNSRELYTLKKCTYKNCDNKQIICN